jgi:hypothetical protein
MMNFRKIAVGTLMALAMCMPSSAFADEKVRTTICDTPDTPIEFTKEWYEHKCKIIYATHGGYAPGAREPQRKAKKADTTKLAPNEGILNRPIVGSDGVEHSPQRKGKQRSSRHPSPPGCENRVCE